MGKLPSGLLGHFTGEVALDLHIGTTDLHYPVMGQIEEAAAGEPERRRKSVQA